MLPSENKENLENLENLENQENQGNQGNQGNQESQENLENQWVPVYQVPLYQVYKEDQDQISDATYISDVVFEIQNQNQIQTTI